VKVMEALRQRARALLESGAVKMVLGFKKGSSGRSSPAFIFKPEDCDRLIIDDTCSQNLANYLLKIKNRVKVAVVARGCDSRSIVVLLQEKQIKREDVYILGVGCEGVKEKDDELSPSCRHCQYPNPVIYDEMIGAPVARQANGKDDKFRQLSCDERWRELSADVSRCIRCYACRQVCPNCYCPVCFVDLNMPQVAGKSHSVSDNMVFHIGRAWHMAGRCVECGACHRACPMGIDLMRFNREVARIVRERFGFVAGLNPDERPALASFRPDDPQEFFFQGG